MTKDPVLLRAQWKRAQAQKQVNYWWPQGVAHERLFVDWLRDFLGLSELPPKETEVNER